MEKTKLHLERESDLKKRENDQVLIMAKRMSRLEEQVKEVQEKLNDAVKTIAEKDEELEKLKAQVLKKGSDKFDDMNNQPEVGRSDCERMTIKKKIPPKQNQQTNEITNIRKFTEEFEEKINMPEYPDQRPCSKSERERNKLSTNFPNSPSNESIVNESNSSNDESLDEYAEKTSQEMEEEFLRLANQVTEMETFLADYGLIWVGDAKIRDGNRYRKVQASIGFSPNFDKTIMVINELNDRVSSESHIEISKKAGKFKKADVLKLTLFADGIQLEDNAFREYSSESVQEFFHDLEDGYYPTELKDIYPDGVIFRVIDNRSTTFEETQNNKQKPFSGKGHTLGSVNVEHKRQIPPYPGPSERKKDVPPQEEASKKKGTTVKAREKPIEFNKRKDHSGNILESMSTEINVNKPAAVSKVRTLEEDGKMNRIDSEETIAKGKKMHDSEPVRIYDPEILPSSDLPKRVKGKEIDGSEPNRTNEPKILPTSDLPKRVKGKEIDGPEPNRTYEPEILPTSDLPKKVTQETERKVKAFLNEEDKSKIKMVNREYSSDDTDKTRTLHFRDKIEITNITYNEGPITIQQTQESQEAMINSKDCHKGSTCNCPTPEKSLPKVPLDSAVGSMQDYRQFHETKTPNSTSKQPEPYRDYVYTKEIIHSPDASSPSLTPSVPRVGETEYRQNYDQNVKNIIEAINKRSPVTKPPEINPNEEFEHFTFLGKPKTDQTTVEGRKEGNEEHVDNLTMGNTETSASSQQKINLENEEAEERSIGGIAEEEEETPGIVTFPDDTT